MLDPVIPLDLSLRCAWTRWRMRLPQLLTLLLALTGGDVIAAEATGYTSMLSIETPGLASAEAVLQGDVFDRKMMLIGGAASGHACISQQTGSRH